LVVRPDSLDLPESTAGSHRMIVSSAMRNSASGVSVIA
jgi:hypothetical protein